MMTVAIDRVVVSDVVGRPVLSGRQHGAADRPKLLSALNAAAGDGLVLVDLKGTEFLSSSYFDEALWPLWVHSHEDVCPVLANVPDAAADDIGLVLKALGVAAIWCVRGEEHIAFDEAALLGTLDRGLEQIITTVKSKGEITAGDLVNERSSDSIGATAWSNRLAVLHRLRLLRRRKDGRRLIYGLPWSVGHG